MLSDKAIHYGLTAFQKELCAFSVKHVDYFLNQTNIRIS